MRYVCTADCAEHGWLPSEDCPFCEKVVVIVGIEIGLVDPNQKGPPFPLKTYLKLTCDGNHRGFCDSGPPSQRFTAGNFIKDYAAAMKAGWKEIHNSRCMFLCPSCSGKTNNG